jgi:hypothetical protein
MKSLKEMYGLSNDSSGFDSGLTNWYNLLIDKTYDNLTVSDVCKMIRQDILKSVAIVKAIELFLNNPYDGEYCDGGLLNVLVSLEINSYVPFIDRLKTITNDIKQNYANYEWSDDEAKNQFALNIEKMLNKLECVESIFI